MKISVVSDLHLECGYQELPGGEVLILAGDIAEARSIRKDHHSTKTLLDHPHSGFPCSEFFRWECAKYEKVFYVMGNHEHYGGRFDKTYTELLGLIPSNVTLLEDQCEEYNGVLFVGSSLWTDCNRYDPVTFMHLKWAMSDYKVITNHYKDKGLYHKLIPEHTAEVHRKSRDYIRIVAEQNRDKPIIVTTHHAPSFGSVHQKYWHDTVMNGGYASELSELILDNPNIRYWFHGHMHDPVDYMIGTTRVMSNPRGYEGIEDTHQFNPNFTIEI
jgi:hypothetical protein